MLRHIFKLIKTNLIVLTVFLLILEILFQFLPVSGSRYTQNVTDDNPILRVKPNHRMTFSKGNFDIVAKKVSNNMGFWSDYDYIPSKRPSLAIIGDSYVEALHVTNSDSFHGRLADSKNLDVYALGFSGAQFPTYLAYAKFAEAQLDPDAYCFVIIANDFDESFTKNTTPGFHFFETDSTGKVQLKRNDYQFSTKKKILSKSALVRYLHKNINLPTKIKRALQAPVATSAPISTEIDIENRRFSQAATDSFLTYLSTLIPSSKPVFFVVDADRQAIYSGNETPNLQWQTIRQDFIRTARQKGYHVIDLQDAFQEAYTINKQHFEFASDWHWNAYGHQVVSEAIATSVVFKRLVK